MCLPQGEYPLKLGNIELLDKLGARLSDAFALGLVTLALGVMEGSEETLL